MSRRRRRLELRDLGFAATPGTWPYGPYEGGFLVTEAGQGSIALTRTEEDARFLIAARPDVVLRVLSGLPITPEQEQALRTAAAAATAGKWVAEGRWDVGPFAQVSVVAVTGGAAERVGMFSRDADAAYAAALRPDRLIALLF